MDRNTTELCCPLYQCGESQLHVGTSPEGAPGTFMCHQAPSRCPHPSTMGAQQGATGSPQVVSMTQPKAMMEAPPEEAGPGRGSWLGWGPGCDMDGSEASQRDSLSPPWPPPTQGQGQACVEATPILLALIYSLHSLTQGPCFTVPFVTVLPCYLHLEAASLMTLHLEASEALLFCNRK